MKNYHKVIRSYNHNGRIGVLVEFGMESDFTEKVEEVSLFLKDVALHIAASNPKDTEELLLQPFVKDQSASIGELMSELASKMHDRIGVVRFERWDADEREIHPESPPRGPANIIRFAQRK